MITYTNISWLPFNSKIEIVFKEEKDIPVTAVFCFILSEDKKNIYLMENKNKNRGLDIPGGHIEPGETELEALHREVMEEVGLSIKEVSYVGSQVIKKEVIDDRYPYLISAQKFYVATIDKIETNKLADDSLNRVSLNLLKYYETIANKEDCYFKDLLKKVKDKIEGEENE